MIHNELSCDDVQKLIRAYEALDCLINKVTESNLRYGRECKIAPHIMDAHQLLHDVLFGTN